MEERYGARSKELVGVASLNTTLPRRRRFRDHLTRRLTFRGAGRPDSLKALSGPRPRRLGPGTLFAVPSRPARWPS